MTIQIFVKQEAFKDLMNWLNELEQDEPGTWLLQRVRLCTQSTPGWIPVNVSLDDWQTIRDYFDDHITFQID
jgi:hypothetical protein